MKIYVDGCSYTYGGELKDPEKTRYSTLLGNKIGAEVCNVAQGGASNARIVRNLLVENDITKYDLAIIQLTFPERLEYYDPHRIRKLKNNEFEYKPGLIMVGKKKGWTNITIHSATDESFDWENGDFGDEKIGEELRKGVRPINKQFWTQYYKSIYQEEYGRAYEQIAYTTIKNHCKINNVPLALLTCDDSTPLEYTLQLNNGKRYAKAKYKHPNELGHTRIALDLMFIIKTAKMFKN